MFRTLTLLCLMATCVLGKYEGSLKVRFDITIFGIGTSAFIELPQSNTTASAKGWVQTTRPDGPSDLSSLTMWCPSTDYTICVLMDDTGYIAGLQIAVDVDLISGSIYDWDIQGFTSWTIDLNGTTKTFWTTHQYFISAASLATDPATRIAARDSSTILQDTAVWVPGFNGALYAISTNVSEITSENSDFTKQACIPWMGRHYYYKMTTDTECKADTLFPWFPLVYQEQLIGVGLVAYGKHSVVDGQTNWFEEPSSGAVKAIVPNGPDCLYNLADTPGIFTIHVYYIKRPYTVTCLFRQ